MRIQQIADSTPSWANWTIIVGSAALSWIQAAAGIVAIVWGGLQIYSWFVNRGWRRKGR